MRKLFSAGLTYDQGAQAGKIGRDNVSGLILIAAVTLITAGSASAQQSFKSILVPTARTEQTLWKFTIDDPGTDWQTADYSDAAWSTGPGGFGTRITPAAAVGTEWASSDIWLRKTVTIPDPATLDGLGLLLHHDEAVEIYVNGALVLQDTGYSRDYYSAPLDLEGRNAFKAGENVIAVHCHQTIGGQFIDVGLEYVVSGTKTDLIADSRSESQVWSWTTEAPASLDWIGTAFEDGSWSSGYAGFGANNPPNAVINTGWTTGDIWLRKKFNLADVAFNHVFVTVHHDEDVMIAINGRTMLQMTGYSNDYSEVDITAAALAVMQPGENVLAVYCHQTGGGQYIDVGLKSVITEPPVSLRSVRGANSLAPLASRASVRHSSRGILFPGFSGPGGVAFRFFDVQGKGFPALVR